MQTLIKKVLIVCITLFIISILIFIVFHIIPGDPAMQILGTEASAERLEILREKLGINKSLFEQYISWIKGFFTGDLGVSIKYNKPVKALIIDRIPVTVALAAMSMLLVLVISIPASAFCGRIKNKFFDGLINLSTMINISMPEFFLGILFIWVFGILLNLFAPGAYISYSENFTGFIQCLFFPALVIAVPNSAMVIKFLRSSILSELKADYVKTAYSKGNSENSGHQGCRRVF